MAAQNAILPMHGAAVRTPRVIPIGSRLPPLLRLALVLAALSATLCPPLSAADAPEGRRTLHVSFSALGPEAQEEGADPADFAASVGARPGFSADLSGKKAPSWHQPPDGVPANEWVSLVMVGFRTRRDWLAFVFDGPQGSASLAARRPARIVVGKALRRDWIAPGETQISPNAVKELAADLGRGLIGGRAPADGGLVSVSVRPWKRAAGEQGAALELPEKEADEGLGGGDEGPTGGASEQDIEGFRALAFAAACAAGWNPTARPAERTLKLEVARGVNTYSVRATLADKGAQRQAIKDNIPAEDIYVNLVRLCLKLSPTDDVLDFQRLGREGLRVLAWSDDRLIVQSDGALVAHDPATGKTHWTIEKPVTGAYHYAPALDADGRSAVFRCDAGLYRVDKDGKLVKLSDASPAGPRAFCVGRGGDVFVLTASALSRCAAGETKWTFKSLRPLTCGPALNAERVFAGDEAATLICLATDDGHEVWHKNFDEPLVSPLFCAGGNVVCTLATGKLCAVSAADGKFVWTAFVGDALLKPVRETTGGLLVASKDNHVRLLDPATGERKAEVAFDTWLVDVEPGEGTIVCADLGGAVTFLDPATLKLQRKVRLPARPAPGIICAASFPHRWAGADGLVFEEGHAALVCDADGFLYAFSLPAAGAGRKQP